MAYEPIQGMELVVATVSGYRGSERQNLIKLMTHAGVSFVSDLSRSNAFTHLVCWKFQGRKYELPKKFKIIIVNHQWIEDCIKQRKRVPEHPYTFQGCPVEKSVRSLMNVPFTLEKSELEGEFIKEAAKENMVQLKGHRSVGGMRASIYNAMPLAGGGEVGCFHEGLSSKACLIEPSKMCGFLIHHFY